MTIKQWSPLVRLVAFAAFGALATVPAGCDRVLPQRSDLALPDTSTVRQLYAEHGLTAEFRYSGNVLELVVQQPADQLRRGGPLWARVGPYIYVFSPGTRELFEQYPGVAGVRAVTMTGDTEIARVLLVREGLNDLNWRRSRALLGEALEHGTARPSTMDRLVQFGEQHTQFQYNPEYAPRR
jgi:hypothetical protein